MALDRGADGSAGWGAGRALPSRHGRAAGMATAAGGGSATVAGLSGTAGVGAAALDDHTGRPTPAPDSGR